VWFILHVKYSRKGEGFLFLSSRPGFGTHTGSYSFVSCVRRPQLEPNPHVLPRQNNVWIAHISPWSYNCTQRQIYPYFRIAHLRQQCHNSKFVIFQERLWKVLKCYNFLWVQRRHNCSPAASFANCVMTLYLLKVHLQTFLSTPITQKWQILSCDTLVANERYAVAALRPPANHYHTHLCLISSTFLP